MATRLLWMVFCPFEFVVTVGVGVVLYLGGALYFAACVYVAALSGLFERASALALQRCRVGRIFGSKGEKKTAPVLSEVAARGPEVRGRFDSWLN